MTKNARGRFRNIFIVRPLRRLKKLMPRSLFGRTLLILVIPTLLTLAVATFVFFDRHWATTTHRLTHAVSGEIAVAVTLLERATTPEEEKSILDSLRRKLDMAVAFQSAKPSLPSLKKRFVTPLEAMLRGALRERVSFPFSVTMQTPEGHFTVHVRAEKRLYVFTVPSRRIYTPTTEAFIGWMVGSSLLLSSIALLFMRNQVRPVRRLAAAAESIGKGQDAPWFKPEGAAEVRQASIALMHMRDRLRRSMTQRTAMLAGVSHDLRTPLTRMKLALAMMQETAQTRGFQEDIADMETMLEAYLAFAKGEEFEAPSCVDLVALVREISARMHNVSVDSFLAPVTATLRVNAMKRCLVNLVGNASRYGKNVAISLRMRGKIVDIFVDDDGPGIPLDKRKDVFRPFFRLEESRNMATGGVGLGLSIARDIARGHGGDIVLEDSPLGGLRAHVWFPG